MQWGFRHGDPRFPFFWEGSAQPAARWHDDGHGPVQYLADTPDGAWAEFLRHEEITDAADLMGVRRRIWAVQFDMAAEQVLRVDVPLHVTTGDRSSYRLCQESARRLRAKGATCLVAPSAALSGGAARGQVTDRGLREADHRDGRVWVLLGSRPAARGWAAVDAGAPAERILGLVRHFGGHQNGRAPPGAVTPDSNEQRHGMDRRNVERRTTIDLVRYEACAPERRTQRSSNRRSGADRRARPGR